MAPAFTNAGMHLALVNYTLAPEASMDQIVDENRRAMAWLARHVGEYGGDSSRIQITGHSAGGHFVGMMMATDWEDYSNSALGNDVIAGGTSISGLFDLEPIRLYYLNETLGLDAEFCAPKQSHPPETQGAGTANSLFGCHGDGRVSLSAIEL